MLGICPLLVPHPRGIFPTFDTVVRDAPFDEGDARSRFPRRADVCDVEKQIPHDRPHISGAGSG
jgi:hypothetical protein